MIRTEDWTRVPNILKHKSYMSGKVKCMNLVRNFSLTSDRREYCGGGHWRSVILRSEKR